MMSFKLHGKQYSTYKEVESELDKLEKLRFEGSPGIKSKSVKDFLLKEFFVLNKQCKTLTENNKVDCEGNKDRSLVDIYRLCRAYFPKCGLKDIRETLLESNDVATLVCGQVQRRVYYPFKKYEGGRSGLKYHEDTPDEFGWTLDNSYQPKDE